MDQPSDVMPSESVAAPAENLGDVTPKAKNRKKGAKAEEVEAVAGD